MECVGKRERHEEWLSKNMLTAKRALEYFRTTSFYKSHCDNEKIFAQHARMDDVEKLKKMDGIQYMIVSSETLIRMPNQKELDKVPANIRNSLQHHDLSCVVQHFNNRVLEPRRRSHAGIEELIKRKDIESAMWMNPHFRDTMPKAVEVLNFLKCAFIEKNGDVSPRLQIGVIQMVKRDSENDVKPLAMYYILDDYVYESSKVFDVFRDRMLNTIRMMKSVNEGLNTSVSYDLSEGSTLMHLYGTDGTEDLSEDGAEKDVSEKMKLSSARRAAYRQKVEKVFNDSLFPK